MKRFNVILIISLLLPMAVNARRIYEAEKVFSYSYPASSNHTLIVENKYGNIDIEIWDKNEVSAIVTITGLCSRDQEAADDLIDKVKIIANTSGNTVSFSTEFLAIGSSSRFGRNVSRQVSYSLKVPRGIAFNLNNKYGNVTIDECSNSTAVDVKYGNFYCNKIADKKAMLILAYGNASIEDVNALSADIKYSNLKITTANTLFLDSKYSNMVFRAIANLSSTSAYDSYKISQVNTANIGAKYTNVKIDLLEESTTIQNKYGGVSIGDVGKHAKSLTFDLSYTGLSVNINPEICYKLDALTSYGKILLPENVAVNLAHREQVKNTVRVRGNIGKGDPSLTVKVTNSYADTKLTSK